MEPIFKTTFVKLTPFVGHVSMIIPALIYSWEIWMLNKTICKLLIVFERRILRAYRRMDSSVAYIRMEFINDTTTVSF